RAIEPMTDAEKIRTEIALVSEMSDALGMGQSPPFGGLHDVRLLVRRAAIGSMLSAEQLLEVADTLTCTGNMYRYRMRLDPRCTRLIELLTPIEDLGVTAKTITGCIDTRGHVLDMASPELSDARRKLADIDERVQERIRKLLRDPKLREVLRYPNATVSGDHYVLPVAVNHRHRVQGVVHRPGGRGGPCYTGPAGIAVLSAERAVLKGDEEREVRRVLRRLTADIGRIAKPLGYAIALMARLDFLTAKARFSRDYQMYAPDINTEGRLWLRQARHALLEHLFRGERGQESGVRGQESGVRGQESGVRGQESGAAGQGGILTPDSCILTPDSCLLTPQAREVVPIDVRLGIGFNLLIITGPN